MTATTECIPVDYRLVNYVEHFVCVDFTGFFCTLSILIRLVSVSQFLVLVSQGMFGFGLGLTRSGLSLGLTVLWSH